jgi:RNA polymerase sigma-70 factor, ECF subfamily
MERGALLAEVYQAARHQLISYVTRMVVRPAIAEEIVQQAALRLTESPRPPTDAEGTRAWLFRAATNLAIDHLRRHSTWREDVLLETQQLARRDEGFIAESRLLQGSPEMRAIAREHLAVCLACTLRASAPQHAAALLLAEIYGFTVPETADVLGASITQVKNWIQTARARLREKYAATCALVTKQGVCYQCVELSEFFNRRREDPLDGTARDVDARLAILREQRETALGPWHRIMMRLVDAVLGPPP